MAFGRAELRAIESVVGQSQCRLRQLLRIKELKVLDEISGRPKPERNGFNSLKMTAATVVILKRIGSGRFCH